MAERPDLPDYKKPPVVEVALAVQFERLSALRTQHIGLLWSEYRDRYPLVEEQPLIEPVYETFNKDSEGQKRLSVRITETPVFPRCWFLNTERTRLIQVQNDRFIFNWRKIEGDEEYPRYKNIRSSFVKELEIFSEFIKQENLGKIVPDQCDVTYVNAIPTDEDIENHSEISDVIRTFKLDYKEDADLFQLSHEDTRIHSRFIMPNESGEPVGRLHISIEPRYRTKDGLPIFLFKLTARGTPQPKDIEGILKFLDRGNVYIVTGFTAWTEKFMHKKKWIRKGRQDDN